MNQREFLNVLASSIIANDELLTAQLKIGCSDVINIAELLNWLEEADCRTVPHVNWIIKNCARRIAVLSKDADTIVLLLRYMATYCENDLKQLRAEYGAGRADV